MFSSYPSGPSQRPNQHRCEPINQETGFFQTFVSEDMSVWTETEISEYSGKGTKAVLKVVCQWHLVWHTRSFLGLQETVTWNRVTSPSSTDLMIFGCWTEFGLQIFFNVWKLWPKRLAKTTKVHFLFISNTNASLCKQSSHSFTPAVVLNLYVFGQ